MNFLDPNDKEFYHGDVIKPLPKSNLQYKGTATVEMLKDGRYFLRFSGEVIEHIRRKVVQIFGKSTKRITKKRIKNYMKKMVIDTAKRDIEIHEGQIAKLGTLTIEDYNE